MVTRKKSVCLSFAVMLLLSLFVIPVSAENAQAFDTVLVLDVSSSMYDELDEMCDSAVNACREILDANPSNQIAIVSFGTDAEISCDLTNNYETLKNEISSLSTNGLTNLYHACELAYQVLHSSASVNSVKNVLIMTDGFPCEGEWSNSGRYNNMFPSLFSGDCSNVSYANSVYDYVSKNLHPIANVYASGFFYFNENDPNSLDDEEKLAVQLVKDLANAKSYFPTSAGTIFDDIVDDVLEQETTTEMPETTSAPETAAQTLSTAGAMETSNIIINPIDNNEDKNSSSSAAIAIGAISTVGLGGLIALIIFLLTRKPHIPPAPIAGPIVLPVSDDDDEEDTNKMDGLGGGYIAPDGIEEFASGADTGSESNRLPGAVIYGVAGLYRDSSIAIKNKETIVIGRNPKACNLIITDDVEKVSRVHCSISYNASDRSFVVIDMSKNGTFTKETKLPYNTPITLRPGTEIRIADSSNIFRLG